MPYSAIVKTGYRRRHRANGVALLPVSLLTTVVDAADHRHVLGWWKYATRPSRAVVSPASATALIIATTTLAYTFSGVSSSSRCC